MECNSTINRTIQDKSFIIECFEINNQYVSNKTIIANEFCRYFRNIGETYALTIPPINISVSTYLSKCVPMTL